MYVRSVGAIDRRRVSRTGMAVLAAPANGRGVAIDFDSTFGAGNPISPDEAIERDFRARLALRMNFEKIGDLLSPAVGGRGGGGLEPGVVIVNFDFPSMIMQILPWSLKSLYISARTCIAVIGILKAYNIYMYFSKFDYKLEG